MALTPKSNGSESPKSWADEMIDIDAEGNITDIDGSLDEAVLDDTPQENPSDSQSEETGNHEENVTLIETPHEGPKVGIPKPTCGTPNMPQNGNKQSYSDT